MLAHCLVEKVSVDRSMINESGSHVPIRGDHTQIASDLGVHHRLPIFVDACRVETKDPVSCFSHLCLAAKIVKFQDQVCRFYFAHLVLPPIDLKKFVLCLTQSGKTEKL